MRRAALLVAVVVAIACGRTSDRAGQGGADWSADPGLSLRESLGRRIFEDATLSEPPGVSCASCHDPVTAFAGSNGLDAAPVAAGSRPGVLGDRNVPTLLYASYSPSFAFVPERKDDGTVSHEPKGGQFWDGRARDLAEQAGGPLLAPREMNNPSKDAVVGKIRRGPYAGLFRTVYGRDSLDDSDRAFDQMADAVAAFEGTKRFHPFSSKFDDYLRGEARLEPIEARGFELFQDPEKGNCIACHAGVVGSRVPSDWLFTDFTYDNLGVPRNDELDDNLDPEHFDLGLCEGVADRTPAGAPTDELCGAFKVPTLRNVERTAPYMHNGYFRSLRDVVRFYATRDTEPETWYPLDPSGGVRKFDDVPPAFSKNVNTSEVPYDREDGERPRLDDAEIDAIVAFLRTLTDR